jgi:diguanylate cyclase (GGDEF)-like protein/PAS domain S-box-containing protein
MTEPESFYKDILDNMADGVYFLDLDRKITYWNKGAEKITGYPAQKVLGISCKDNLLNHVNIKGECLCLNGCPMAACMETGDTISANVYLHHANGHRVPVKVRAAPIRDEAGNIIGAVETFSSETEDLNIRQELAELRQSLQTDELTGIGSRRFIEGKLYGLIAEQDFRKKMNAGVLFFDIDRFKEVNDTYGHKNGDKVLKMVSATIAENLRKSDVVGRWGGEEFLAILYDISSLRALTFVAEKIRILVENSRLDLEDAGIKVTVSIGATLLYPIDTVDSITRRADSLMYDSKRLGRNRVTVG